MITFKNTLNYIKQDFHRRLLLENKSHSLWNLLTVLFKQGMVSVVLYRISRYCVFHKLGFISHLLVILEHYYCKNEISPMADIGPGLVLEGMAIGISSYVVVGENCTFFGRNTITLGMMEGIDSQDKIVIGNGCIFGLGARVMRPVELADGVQVKPNSLVMTSIKTQGSILLGQPARRYSSINVEKLAGWSPLLNRFINEAAV